MASDCYHFIRKLVFGTRSMKNYRLPVHGFAAFASIIWCVWSAQITNVSNPANLIELRKNLISFSAHGAPLQLQYKTDAGELSLSLNYATEFLTLGDAKFVILRRSSD